MALEPKNGVANDRIQFPSSIQNFGAILATDTNLGVVTHASRNAGEVFGVASSSVIGTPLTHFMSQDDMHAIANILGHPTIKQKSEVLPSLTIQGATYQVFLHRTKNHVVFEFFSGDTNLKEWQTSLEKAKAFISMPFDSKAPLHFMQEAVERLRSITGMDRATICKLSHSDENVVIAEARHPKMVSLLGRISAASDIPPSLRALYVMTPVQFISDANEIPLLQIEGAEPLNLSLAVLRGKSEAEKQDLTNLGVASILTLPIVVNNQLWGMIHSHHSTNYDLDPSVLKAVELVGRLVSLRLQHEMGK